MFFALLARYAPVSSLAAYLPVVRSLPRRDHIKLALTAPAEAESGTARWQSVLLFPTTEGVLPPLG